MSNHMPDGRPGRGARLLWCPLGTVVAFGQCIQSLRHRSSDLVVGTSDLRTVKVVIETKIGRSRDSAYNLMI